MSTENTEEHMGRNPQSSFFPGSQTLGPTRMPTPGAQIRIRGISLNATPLGNTRDRSAAARITLGEFHPGGEEQADPR